MLIPGFETEEHWRNDYPDELSDDDDDAYYRSAHKLNVFLLTAYKILIYRLPL